MSSRVAFALFRLNSFSGPLSFVSSALLCRDLLDHVSCKLHREAVRTIYSGPPGRYHVRPNTGTPESPQ